MSTYTKISSAQFSRTKMELGTIHCSGSVISRTQQFLEERSGESLRPKEVSLRFPVISTYNSEMICRSSDLDITHSRPGSLEPGSRFSIRSSSRIEESAQECGVLPRTPPSSLPSLPDTGTFSPTVHFGIYIHVACRSFSEALWEPPTLSPP